MTTKRILSASAALIFALCLLLTPALASNRVNSIEIYVELASDGSALVTQTWTGSFDEGTECYIPVSDSGYLTLSDLTASMDGEAYETLENWNVKASFDDKAYKCAINRVDGGYEICWGLSNYGRHTYTVSYTVDPLVGSYDDADGFNFMFVNRDMNTTPTDVNLLITYPEAALTAENSGAWAFGFEGQVEFVPEGVQVWSTSPLDKSDYVVVMLEAPKGMFSGAPAVGGSFEDVKQRAFDGSDYDDDDRAGLIAAGSLIALGGGIAGVGIALSARRKRAIKAICESGSPLSGAPNGGDMLVTWRMGRLFGLIRDEGTIIGALLCDLMTAGCIISTDPMATGKKAANVPLRMIEPPSDTASGEYALYELLLSARDGNDYLEPKRVKKCFRRHPETMRDLLREFEQKANASITAQGLFSGKVSTSPKRLTEKGKAALSEVWQLKRALESAGADDPVFRMLTPEECCAYALLFDFKSEYLTNIRACYPSTVSERWSPIYSMYWYSHYYRGYSYGEMRRAESSGSGGSSSGGGGGGFSGGGSGGGTR